ncbi:fungal pheromone mating factor STE2 GPCR-domain-containing protein [Xylariaceae sp. FL0804]|nr:fungal pheromone mating factor STE2 GPCR-domain-containing protein [Xylariaceae sp. FL0804]
MESTLGDDFDPLTQNFTLVTSNGTSVAVSLAAIEAQRVRLANTSINYGVQLGITLLTLIAVLMLLPSRRMRKPLNVVQVWALVASVVRLALLVLYFPSSLAGYYVSWTLDASVLRRQDYADNTAANAFSVVQFALVELALTLQSWSLVRTWESPGPGQGRGRGRARAWERPAVLAVSVVLASATVAVKLVWVVHHTHLARGRMLPVPLDAVGEAAVVLGAVSIFYFCGIFFAHISLHLFATRAAIQRRHSRGLTSLEILAIGNGVLMLVPSLFAGLDIAAGPGKNKILPFDAGSWVQTLVVTGLPLISLVAFYRGSDANLHRRRVSLFAHGGGPSPLDSSRAGGTTLGDLSSPGAASSTLALGRASANAAAFGPPSPASLCFPNEDLLKPDEVHGGAAKTAKGRAGDLEQGFQGGIQVRRDYSVTVGPEEDRQAPLGAVLHHGH